MRTSSARLVHVFLLGIAAGCAEVDRLPGDSGGHAGGGGSTASSNSGAGGFGGQGGMAGWTDCSTPEGYGICGGPNLCSYDPADCALCGDAIPEAADDLTVCWTEELAAASDGGCGYQCADGDICIAYNNEDLIVNAFLCAPYNLGVLYAQSGAPDRVRYADLGLWTGELLPLPDSCPILEGVTVCGGNCGGCPANEVCTGRSPLHPYSICVDEKGLDCNIDNTHACDDGFGCFIYTVEPAAQALADQHGHCMPVETCQKTAVNLPGGGKCIAQ